MTKKRLKQIEKDLQNLSAEELVTLGEWLELLKADQRKALYLLNEAERVSANMGK